jgi:hypothetical protein
MKSKPEQESIKIVGSRNPRPFWERFTSLQRRSHLILGKPVSPKGVFRFKSFEEFDEWKKRYQLQEPPNQTTS